MFNNEGECGTGAVVPWADRLWVITYGPHLPFGSSDKLYEITSDLKQVVRPESVGGTPANLAISVMDDAKVEVIAGINLPILVKLATIRGEAGLADAVTAARDAGRKYIKVASQELTGEA